MIEDIYIVDDFYENPDVLRALALKAAYKNYGNQQNYPGHESIKAYYSDGIAQKFESILTHPITYDPAQYVFGKFRYSIQNDVSKTKIHLDWPVDWTGIVYLSEDQHNRGGLGIYRNKETGISRLEKDAHFFESFGCENIQQFDAKYVYPHSSDMSKWEQIEEIPTRYNRLVLFQGSSYFHAITEQFGDSIDNARLTQNFFFFVKGDSV